MQPDKIRQNNNNRPKSRFFIDISAPVQESWSRSFNDWHLQPALFAKPCQLSVTGRSLHFPEKNVKKLRVFVWTEALGRKSVMGGRTSWGKRGEGVEFVATAWNLVNVGWANRSGSTFSIFGRPPRPWREAYKRSSMTWWKGREFLLGMLGPLCPEHHAVQGFAWSTLLGLGLCLAFPDYVNIRSFSP